jgi:hypothetical protein
MRIFISLSLALCLGSCGTEAEEAPTDVAPDSATDTAVDTPLSGDTMGDGSVTSDTTSDASVDAGTPEWATCELNSQCMLAANTCCGVCGQAQLDDVDPINTEGREAHSVAVCDEPDPTCPGCPSQLNPWIGATCDGGACNEFDLREDPITECTSDEECVLRSIGCCECGANTEPEALISIRLDSVSDYTGRVCDPDATCSGCVPVYPGWVESACSDEGRCYVSYLPD